MDAHRAIHQRNVGAATQLLALPWELLHDDHGYLFQSGRPVVVRRRLPNRQPLEAAVAELPIRILLFSPRPEDEGAGYIDHRISARPLVQAVAELGELVELTLLTPPTLLTLNLALGQAREAGAPFDVLHFDGHGVFDPKHGLGGLCFEDPKDQEKLQQRASQIVRGDQLADTVRAHRIPLVFLEACQSAQSEQHPDSSVAAKLLEEGCSSVVAMGYSVLVATAQRFVAAFYQALAAGKPVGQALRGGQQALHDDDYRLDIMGAGELRLQDWFVPVLYQQAPDPQLFTRLPPEAVKRLLQRVQQLSLGALPETPDHSFIGSSRELLAAERLLQREGWALLRGSGGVGKTTLAVELARWLVATHRTGRAAFVSLESCSDARSMLDALGRQLLPDYSVAHYQRPAKALQPVTRALADRPTLVLFDNCESVLDATAAPIPGTQGEANGSGTSGPSALTDILALWQALLDADPRTRLLFTSREPLPAPFDTPRSHIGLGALSREDAIELVGKALKTQGLAPAPADPGSTPAEVEQLVEAVGRHARVLVLLAGEVARAGVKATTEDLQQLMARLHERHPDDRERSLFASVELSLRRLSPTAREQARVLAVFHGGANLAVVAMMLELELEGVARLARELVEVGLTDAAELRLLLEGLEPPQS